MGGSRPRDVRQGARCHFARGRRSAALRARRHERDPRHAGGQQHDWIEQRELWHGVELSQRYRERARHRARVSERFRIDERTAPELTAMTSTTARTVANVVLVSAGAAAAWAVLSNPRRRRIAGR